MPEFDRFDDNTFAVTISLAEYRALVAENTRMHYAIESMEMRIAVLNEQLAVAEGFPPEDEDEQPGE